MRKRDQERLARLLEEERKRRHRQRGELEESVRRSLRDSSGDSAYSQHMADVGSDAMEREQNLMLAASLSRTIEDIDEALRKLRRGTYGDCESCGCPIDPKRLEALPYARLCLACQEATDEGRAAGPKAGCP